MIFNYLVYCSAAHTCSLLEIHNTDGYKLFSASNGKQRPTNNKHNKSSRELGDLRSHHAITVPLPLE